MATKGYIIVSFLEIARLVVRFGRKELVADYFKELEEAIAYYYWEQELAEGGCVLKWFWEVVIKLYVERGWLDLAFEAVVEKGAKFGLLVELYKVLLKKLEECRDGERASVIQDLWARQNRSCNMKIYDKRSLPPIDPRPAGIVNTTTKPLLPRPSFPLYLRSLHLFHSTPLRFQ